MTENPYRTHICTEIGDALLDQQVRVAGWVENIRDHGGVLFVDLRDHYGVVQVVVYDEQMLQDVNRECAVSITGTVVKRSADTYNDKIATGTVEIKAISREAGSRTKMAVLAHDANVDAVGACIGPRSSRVAGIVEELGGEKIDIVEYSEDPETFIAAALAPAKVLSVTVDPEGAKSCTVTVPDSQLSLAIGNKGQNARLAARLTGWKIDIRPESGFYGEGAEE